MWRESGKAEELDDANGILVAVILNKARARGHNIIALSRTPMLGPEQAGVVVQTIEVGKVKALDPALATAAAAVLTIRLTPGDERHLTVVGDLSVLSLESSSDAADLV